MGPRLMVIDETGQDAAEMPLTEHEHVIEALAPDRADEPLREGILPWAVGRRMPVARPPTSNEIQRLGSVDGSGTLERVG